jgi:hypothetical protein
MAAETALELDELDARDETAEDEFDAIEAQFDAEFGFPEPDVAKVSAGLRRLLTLAADAQAAEPVVTRLLQGGMDCLFEATSLSPPALMAVELLPLPLSESDALLARGMGLVQEQTADGPVLRLLYPHDAGDAEFRKLMAGEA